MSDALAKTGGGRATPANRLGIDYLSAARDLPVPPAGMVDIHAHVAGERACEIFRDVARAFGVSRVYSMGPLPQAGPIRDRLGEFVRFIAFPNFRAADRVHSFTQGFLDDIRRFHGEFGARIVKLWNAPRLRELIPKDLHADVIEFDSPWRVRAAELAQDLGMMMMVHVADPDTWFATRYSDAAVFGRKRDHYRGLEAMLDRFPMPWIAAHMGGYSEDLDFLSGLLDRHANLSLDTSATKWVVREISRHPRDKARAFFIRYRTRLLFGSDIVTTDEHLTPPPLAAGAARHPMADLASSPQAAAELYASRYFALRTLLETDYEGESPIADPDLKMVDPSKFNDMSAPTLRGLALPRDVIEDLYVNNARRLLGE